MQESRYIPLGLGPGSLISRRYEVAKELGGDRTSISFSVSDREADGKKVRLQLFSPVLSEVFGREEVQKYLQAVCSLDHTNIYRTLLTGKSETNQYYLVSEDIDGFTLAAIAADYPRGMPVPLLVYCLYHASKGLEYAHSRGAVHGRLSPDSITISWDGEIKVKGFELRNITGPGSYCAPEQRESDAVEASTDLFSLGALGCELLTGHLPEFLEVHGMGRNDVPDWLSELLSVMTEKDPTKRPPAMDAVCQTLAPHVLEREQLLQQYANAGAAEIREGAELEGIFANVDSLLSVISPKTVFIACAVVLAVVGISALGYQNQKNLGLARSAGGTAKVVGFPLGKLFSTSPPNLAWEAFAIGMRDKATGAVSNHGTVTGIGSCQSWAATESAGTVQICVTVGDGRPGCSSSQDHPMEYEFGCCPAGTGAGSCLYYRAKRIKPYDNRGENPPPQLCCFEPRSPNAPPPLPCSWDPNVPRCP